MTIKPILRYYGSKYRMLNKIFQLLDLNENDYFFDMFGGSGIVGVNAKNLFNCDVTINDYDKVFPLDKSKALKNLLTFEGNGKQFTEASLRYAIRRLDNGYWDKFNKYNEIIKQCNIISFNIFNSQFYDYYLSNNFNKIYVDPPYFGIEKLYKDSFYNNHHFMLNNLLNKIKNNKIIVISYNDHPQIRELYKDWKIVDIKFTYQSGKSLVKNKKNEILITNIY